MLEQGKSVRQRSGRGEMLWTDHNSLSPPPCAVQDEVEVLGLFLAVLLCY